MTPAVASVSRSVRVGPAGLDNGEVLGRLAGRLAELARTVRAEGGFVGHIKAYVSFSAGGGVGLSVVRDQPEIKAFDFQPQAPASDFKVSVAAIVYNYDEGELSRLLNQSLTAALPGFMSGRAPDHKNLKPIKPYEVSL
jgi:hypothetical protein